jgi:multiple sugar transport system permease protein
VIVYLAVLQTIGFLRMFDLVRNMSDQGQGGPLNRTTTVVLEVYNEGFCQLQHGLRRRADVILLCFVILLITVVQLRVLSRRVEY